MMIGIKNIASYVPAGGVDNYAQGVKFGKDEEFIFGKIGSTFLPRKEDAQETSDLCVEAANRLFANNPQLKREDIDVLICEMAHITLADLIKVLAPAKIGMLCLTHLGAGLDDSRGEMKEELAEKLPLTDAIYLPDDGERFEF